MDEIEKMRIILSDNPDDLLNFLEGNEDSWVGIWAGSHPNVTSEMLVKLSASGNIHILKEVCSNPKTPTQTLKGLFSGKNNELYESLLKNPTLPEGILKDIYLNKNATISHRVSAVSHSNFPAYLTVMAVYSHKVISFKELKKTKPSVELELKTYAMFLFPGMSIDVPYSWVEQLYVSYYEKQ